MGNFVSVFYGKPGWFQWVFKIQNDKPVYFGNLADRSVLEKVNSITLSVNRYSLCTRVENREPVGELLNTDSTVSRIYFWTEIISQNSPASIEHIWFHNGGEVARVKLNITNPRFRTWSSKNLVTGEWEVKAVTESGDVLASTTFKAD